MVSEQRYILSNIKLFEVIVNSACRNIRDDMKKRIHSDTSPVVKIFDPDKHSFKESLVVIVFTCIWLEAVLHLLIVEKFGLAYFEKIDRPLII